MSNIHSLKHIKSLAAMQGTIFNMFMFYRKAGRFDRELNNENTSNVDMDKLVNDIYKIVSDIGIYVQLLIQKKYSVNIDPEDIFLLKEDFDKLYSKMSTFTNIIEEQDQDIIAFTFDLVIEELEEMYPRRQNVKKNC